MSKPLFPFTSIHDFLDKNLSEIGIVNPDKRLIKQLKKKYWRLKNNHTKALKRFEQREVTLYFTYVELKELQKRQAEKQSIPSLVHSLVMTTLKNDSIFVTRHNPKLEQLFFQVIDLLEDILSEQNPILQVQIQELQNRIQTLEQHFEF